MRVIFEESLLNLARMHIRQPYFIVDFLQSIRIPGAIRHGKFLAIFLFGVFIRSLVSKHADNLQYEYFARTVKLKGERVVTPRGPIKNGRSGFEEGRGILVNFTLTWRT